MSLVQNFPFAAIMLYLGGGVGCCVLSGKGARRLCVLLNAFVTGMMWCVLRFCLQTGTSYTFMMGHFPAPWGNELRIGVLEALMSLTFSAVMTLTLLGGETHITEDCEEGKLPLFYTVASLLMASLTALVYTNDLFTGYVFVEINTIASCALVMLRTRSGRALVATTRYLIMSLLGSGLFLMGVVILYGITGHLLMEPMGEKIAELAASGEYALPLTVTVGLFAVGLAIKSALWPFSGWLPDAHASATSAASGILSGLVLKGYIFLLIKIFYRVLGMGLVLSDGVENVLFLFGVGAMVMGSVYALGERDIKRLLGWSSVAQVGYIYAGIGLGTEPGMAAACLQILVHAVTKPLLFLSAGEFMSVSGGSRAFEDVRGAGRRAPLAGLAFAVGALSMIGIPLLGGFSVKLSLSEAALAAGGVKQWVLLGAVVLSSVLNALYYLPALSLLFEKGESGEKRLELRYAAAALVFIVLNVYLGTRSGAFEKAIALGLTLMK